MSVLIIPVKNDSLIGTMTAGSGNPDFSWSQPLPQVSPVEQHEFDRKLQSENVRNFRSENVRNFRSENIPKSAKSKNFP